MSELFDSALFDKIYAMAVAVGANPTAEGCVADEQHRLSHVIINAASADPEAGKRRSVTAIDLGRGAVYYQIMRLTDDTPQPFTWQGRGRNVVPPDAEASARYDAALKGVVLRRPDERFIGQTCLWVWDIVENFEPYAS